MYYAKPGRNADGLCLYLLVKPTGAKSWLLRVQVDGKRRDVGLGAEDTAMRTGKIEESPIEIPILHRKVLTLAEAQERAAIPQKGAIASPLLLSFFRQHQLL